MNNFIKVNQLFVYGFDMRLLMVVDDFYPNTGGTPTSAMGLGKAVARLGIDMTLLTHEYQGQPSEQYIDGLKIIRIPSTVLYRYNIAISPLAFWRVYKRVKQDDYDIVHGLDMYSPLALAATFFAHRRGVPTILTSGSVHTTQGAWNAIYRLMQIVLRRTDKLIAKSKSSEEFFVRLGVPKKRIFVVPNGINISKFDPATAGVEMRNELRIDQEPLVVTAIRLLKKKGPRYLVAAFPKVLETVPDTKLAIAGKGPEAVNLRAQIRKLGIGDSVLMLGELPHEQTLKLMAAADAFVLPSLIESCPNALLEAMAVGVPVVGTRVGGVPEIIENEENGLMVPEANPNSLADAVVRVLEDNQLAKKLKANGVKTVHEKFTWESVAKQTLMVYKKAEEELE